MQNNDLEIQDVNGEATMTAGDPEKADNTRVGTVYALFDFILAQKTTATFEFFLNSAFSC